MKFLGRLEDVFCGVCILAAVFLMFINVVLRYGFHAGIYWSEEIVIYLIIYTTFIGGSICSRERKHLSVDIVPSLLKGKAGKVYKLLIELIGCIVAAVITLIAVKTIIDMTSIVQLSPATRIPMYIPYLSIPIGFALMTIRFGYNVIDMWKAVSE